VNLQYGEGHLKKGNIIIVGGRHAADSYYRGAVGHEAVIVKKSGAYGDFIIVQVQDKNGNMWSIHKEDALPIASDNEGYAEVYLHPFEDEIIKGV
jgi:hypothetical protein